MGKIGSKKLRGTWAFSCRSPSFPATHSTWHSFPFDEGGPRFVLTPQWGGQCMHEGPSRQHEEPCLSAALLSFCPAVLLSFCPSRPVQCALGCPLVMLKIS